MLHVGQYIKKHRILHNLNIETVSKLSGISVPDLVTLEETGFVTDTEMLYNLEVALQIDLVNLNDFFDDDSTSAIHSCYTNLRASVQTNDFEAIQEYLNTFTKLPKHTDVEIKQMQTYAQCLIYSLVDKEFEKSISYAVLNSEFNSLDELIEYIEEDTTIMYNTSFYPILLIIGYNLIQLKELDTLKKLITKLFNHYSNYLDYKDSKPSYLEGRLYIGIISNYAYSLFLTDEISNALNICQLALDKSFEYEKTHMLDTIYKIKTECHYKLGEIKKSKISYITLLELIETTKNTRVLSELNELIETDYPLLKDVLNNL